MKKFNFTITGTAKAEQKEDLEEFLKIMVGEHLDPGNPALDSVTVLTGEE